MSLLCLGCASGNSHAGYLATYRSHASGARPLFASARGGAVGEPRSVSASTRPAARRLPGSWYAATTRGLPPSAVTPESIPANVRQAFRASAIRARSDDTFIVWASAWTKNGGHSGWALVEHLTLEAIMEDGSVTLIHSQRYGAVDDVWGGWFPYNRRSWYRLGMYGANDFDVRTARWPDGRRIEGAFIDTGNHAGRVKAAGHIWMVRWPRDEAPEGTVALRVSSRFVAAGDCLINVGLDRYREDYSDEPVQQCLVSDTYSAAHGLVGVVMVTPRIQWRP